MHDQDNEALFGGDMPGAWAGAGRCSGAGPGAVPAGAGLRAWDQMWPPGVTAKEAGPAGRSTVYWRR